MTCRDVIEFLIDYCDGALPAAERALFEAHIAQCPDCTAYLNSYEATIRLEKAAFDEPLPAELPEGLLQAILAARKK